MEWMLITALAIGQGQQMTQIPFETEALCEQALRKFTTQPGSTALMNDKGAVPRDRQGLFALAHVSARWGMCLRVRN